MRENKFPSHLPLPRRQTFKNVKVVLTHKSYKHRWWAEFGSWVIIYQPSSKSHIWYLFEPSLKFPSQRARQQWTSLLGWLWKWKIVDASSALSIPPGTKHSLSKHHLWFLSLSPSSSSLSVRLVCHWVPCLAHSRHPTNDRWCYYSNWLEHCFATFYANQSQPWGYF